MSYIGQGLPADTFQGFTTDSFTGDGSATTFTLSKEPFSEDTLIVVINNVIQKPTTNFTVSGTTLTIVGTAVASGDVIYAIHMGGPLPIGGAAELDLNGASDKLILDADGDTTISADTDDQIDIKIAGADDFQFTANTFTAQSGSTITTPTLGVGNTKDLGAGIHIKVADSGVSAVNSAADELVLENSASCGLSIFSGTGEVGKIAFGDSDDNNVGEIFYNHSNNDMEFTVNAKTYMKITDDGLFKFSKSESFIQTAHFHEFTNTNGNQQILYLRHEDNSNPYGLQVQFNAVAPDDNTHWFLSCNDTSAGRCIIYSDGDVKNHDGTFTSISSDERLKSNIVDANSQWDDIKAIKFRNFKKKDDIEQYGADNARTLLGVVAQEAETVTPKLVRNRDPYAEEIKLNSAFGTLYEDGDTIPEGKKIGDVKEVKEQVKTFKDSILFWKCAKALQEAMAKIETLETKVKALEDA
jgi:hypothetical protein